MNADQEDIQSLFTAFLEVCNQAIAAHKHEFPYKHIWEAAEALHDGEGMQVTLYDDEPKGAYHLSIKDKHIDLENTAENAAGKGWRINSSYMKEVLQDPESYIKDPTKLDWHWLQHRSD